MKYMGSKRVLLTNGLGKTLDTAVKKASRFVDMFLGTGEVASFVAQRHAIKVYGVDLQAYSVILAEAVLGRKARSPTHLLWKRWHERARRVVAKYRPPQIDEDTRLTHALVDNYRRWCSRQSNRLPVVRAYGGHYFSPHQALWIDALRATLPIARAEKTLALAALIRAASQCVAAPGHTAQPFQPTRTAAPFLKDAWVKDVKTRVKSTLTSLSSQFAKQIGAARIADANSVAEGLKVGDLVFLDPPYSGVQYSRFYHVLETIARGRCGKVTGVGRYPDQDLRPKSRFSLVSESHRALDELLTKVSKKGARAILTFPDHQCSNGMSGDDVRRIAKKHFRVIEKAVASKFSTLGGRGTGTDKVAKRQARHNASELVLLLQSK